MKQSRFGSVAKHFPSIFKVHFSCLIQDTPFLTGGSCFSSALNYVSGVSPLIMPRSISFTVLYIHHTIIL